MTEIRHCEICTYPESRVCTVKEVENINAMADTIPDPSDDLSDENKLNMARDIAGIVDNKIVEIRNIARPAGCKGINDAKFDNKWGKFR